MRCDLKHPLKNALRIVIEGGVLLLCLLLAGVATKTNSYAADFTNQILEVTPISEKEIVGVKIVAEKDIGSRYTSYLLSKPPRVVFDFQGADVARLPAVNQLSDHPVREIRVSLYESAAIKSGRVELILADRVPYKVQIDGKVLLVTFTPASIVAIKSAEVTIPDTVVPPADPVGAPTVPMVIVEPLVEVKPLPPKELQVEVTPLVEAKTVSVSTSNAILSAAKVAEVIGRKGEVFFRADGVLDRCKTFVLKDPARFVIDCFKVTEFIADKSVRLSGPITLVRVGNYPDKVRFVLEGDPKAISKVVAYPVEDGLSLRYDGKTPTKVVPAKAVAATPEVAIKAEEKSATFPPSSVPVNVTPATPEPLEKIAPVPPKAKVRPIAVEKVDFKVEDGKSLVIVELSAPGEVMQPIKDKSLIRFGIKGATITPSLRRTIDAAAFPSVIRQITPYIVNTRGKYDVRFAVELKGDAPYELKNDGKVVTLIVENGAFAKMQAPLKEKIELPLNKTESVPLRTATTPVPEVVTPLYNANSPIITNDTIKAAPEKKYKGELVSLNFDNIEIRNVLLLIAEVSDTNIIANDDVKGVITLRLNNVPWDQALDEILESKGLAMEKEGNILRIAPKKVFEDRRSERTKALMDNREKGETSTRAFQVNYGPVDDIAAKIKEHLKNNGSVTADTRTRQIFVTTTEVLLNEIDVQIIKPLDVPDQQVTIEARIVEANSNFTRDLGVSWGISQSGTANSPWDLNGAMITGGGSFTINPGTQGTGTTAPTFNTSAGIGSLFSFGRIGIDSTILDLRLSALETSGYGKIVSTPRITTSNGEAAEISQGTQIPYQTTSQAGTETKFIAATLALKVKPVINPDNSMILEIEVSNDSVGSTVAVGVGSAPSINTKKAKTKVLVQNGETTVIGGIFIETETESEVGIPLLRSIPIIGYLFKSTKKSKDKTELMIFITPRIVE